ncbi:hypothetical protein L596_001472 [Steinernema carpocapsae]|uniref:Uncharacterized protein n=1 Tax=Steinernema carpocapsae TaxID=34508 RepID=A0A4U8UND6_STECR|nr:hypothetical protein L596_001472 [Steinernema carpocapsae]
MSSSAVFSSIALLLVAVLAVSFAGRVIRVADDDSYQKYMGRSSNYNSKHVRDYEPKPVRSVRCATGLNSFELCKANSIHYDNDVSCFAVWFGNQTFQGCFPNSRSALNQCRENRCESTPSKSGINFCCCFGDDCNQNFISVSP